MSEGTGKFTVTFADLDRESLAFEKDKILIGRLDTCDIVLDHKTVSRVHAAVNFRDEKYYIVNLSSSNVLTLNGRRLRSEQDDVLADGDTIQIGPFTILVGRIGDEMLLVVDEQYTGLASRKTGEIPAQLNKPAEPVAPELEGVLKAFWEKRTREKEDWGTRLRPTEKPVPGKAMFNWRPTRDLKGTWRVGLFVWAILLIGALGVFAYLKYPQVYEPQPLSSPHASKFDATEIAVRENANSCTTCHTANAPIENSCVTCHSATSFHASNTRAHEQAGITCVVCHTEHRGRDFDITVTAIASCAGCHSDNNKQAYNGKTVHTPHGDSYGYPAENGVWKWKGVYREVADAIPEINSSATGDRNEQARLSRQFHTIHVYRLKVPEGLKGDKRGLVSCSTCHNSFGANIDLITPRQTCAACHTTAAGAENRDKRFSSSSANCISCHVQHPYSGSRWSEFMTDDAVNRRKEAVAAKITQLKGQ
jgi:pSer/pThr/pTyr-binding forkhead associated (FHA) protein